MNIWEEILDAEARICHHVLQTPLFYSMHLSALNNGEVYLKLESEQYTGSFKARGALNKVLKLTNAQKDQGLITASTGNHAQGFARALTIAKANGTVYLPENAEKSKIEALKHYHVDLKFHGKDPLTTELFAKQIAKEKNHLWISPYNDMDIIAGQGTIASEITGKLSNIDVLLGCIGGGGMMSGVASWFKEKSPNTQIVGCLPKNSPEMYLSVREGKVVSLNKHQPTLSDGSAGGLEEDSITFPICQHSIDTYELISEDRIASSIKYMLNVHHKVIEGAAAVALASFIDCAQKYKNRRVVIIICGSNITASKLKALI